MREAAVTFKGSSSTTPEDTRSQTMAVLIPCYDEEATIADVIRQFRVHLPDAEIYVFDNNSSDRTVEQASQAGARVFHERRQGKGHVIHVPKSECRYLHHGGRILL